MGDLVVKILVVLRVQIFYSTHEAMSYQLRLKEFEIMISWMSNNEIWRKIFHNSSEEELTKDLKSGFQAFEINFANSYLESQSIRKGRINSTLNNLLTFTMK